VARPNRSDSSVRPKGSESATHRTLQPPQPHTHPGMNHPGHYVPEVPEPRLVASQVLVGLKCSTESGPCVRVGGHRITNTTKHDQVGIRSPILRLLIHAPPFIAATVSNAARQRKALDDREHQPSEVRGNESSRSGVINLSTYPGKLIPVPSGSNRNPTLNRCLGSARGASGASNGRSRVR
jgi:hypothetical protein